jgi:hypothetical protein
MGVSHAQTISGVPVSELEGFFARSHYGYGMKGHPDSVRAVVFALAGDEQHPACGA